MARQKRMQGFFPSNGYWHLRTDPVTGGKLSTKCVIADRDGALRFREERRRLAAEKAIAATLPPKPSDTVATWLDKLLEAKRVLLSSKELSESTVGYYDGKTKPIKKYLGHVVIAELTPSHYDDYVSARRAEGAKGHTIKKELEVCNQALKRAKRARQCPIDIDELFPADLDGSVTPGERALSLDEFCRFYASLPGIRWRAFAVLCILGFRKSEALRQRPEYFEVIKDKLVDDEDGTVIESEGMVCWIDGRKTEGSDRAIPILSPFIPLVKSILGVLPVVELHSYDRTFKAACARAGIPNCNRNDLRRTNATWLIEHGLDERTVASLLGHKTVQMAQRHYNRAKAIALAPIAEAKLAVTAPMVLPVESEDHPFTSGRSRRMNRFPELPGEVAPLPKALGNIPFGNVQKTSRSQTSSSDSLRTPQDSNLRPSDSKSLGQPERFQQTTVLPGVAAGSSGRNLEADSCTFVQKTSRSAPEFSAKKFAVANGLVPLISTSGAVVSWVEVTAEEVDEDLSPELYGRRPCCPIIGADRIRMRGFADKFEGVVS